MSEIDVQPAYDPDHERRLVERQAAADAQTDWSAVPSHDGPPHGADRAIEQWTHRQVAMIGRSHGDAVAAARDEIADLAADGARLEGDAVEARAVEAAAGRERDRLAAVLTGERRGPDEGRWSDPGRMSERVWVAVLVTALIYGAASLVDGGLNYLAFLVMGVSPGETAVLAAGVVLVTVLLPKQLGDMIEARRRGTRQAPRRTPLMIVAAVFWLGVSVFTAVIRTNYLLFPIAAGTDAQRPSLPQQAGVSPILLTAGWLVVALAIGLVVMVHAMRRHNPYVRPWRNAVRHARRAHSETVRLRWESDRASERLRAARDELETTDRRRDRAVESCRAFGDELKQVYRSSYLRALGSPERRRPAEPASIEPQPIEPQHIEPPRERS